MDTEKEKEVERRNALLKLVLSWQSTDILNKDLFKNKVMKLPENFSSDVDYLSSFKQPLLEETRASLCSGLEAVGEAPACEISRLVLCKITSNSPKGLNCYFIRTKPVLEMMNMNPSRAYDTQSGDLILLTNVRPRGMDDLIISRNQFVIASVFKLNQGSFYDYKITSVKEIGPEFWPKRSKRVFATYLFNITTNMRIWGALNPNPKTANLTLIQKVLQYDSDGDQDCALCHTREKPTVLKLMDSLNLDESQKNAVLSCASMRKCQHEGSKVKLIWGPPGTGKTKTVASLLFVLLKLSCKTLICAPTNIAVLQVAERLMELVLASLDHDTYGLGDIILFGNEERMKVNDHSMLVDVFLDYRVAVLSECLLSWHTSLGSMISLLEDPRGKYDAYVSRNVGESDDKAVKEEKGRGKNKNKNKNKKKQQKNDEVKIEADNLMTFTEFVTKTYFYLADHLMYCGKSLYTHLPTSSIPLFVAAKIMRLNDLFNSLEKGRKPNIANFEDVLEMKKHEILTILKSLQIEFPGPKFKGKVKDFCLSNACLVFCTASSSCKVQCRVEMVIIDEAAQLKECESAIPLQVRGVKNAILIGDDRQLPAMVQSKLSEKAGFGRSLFQRLATIGQSKHLLNIQYRMHPSISLFPNREFYDKKIVDGPNVQQKAYEKRFLKGNMYGSYSFIDVARGKEDFLRGHSPRNVEEATIVIQIIAKLFKEHCTSKQKVSVGVISPYKGQVGLIEEKLGKRYTKHKETGFSVSVRSVDGFQGGEEDVIIISTVRGNRNGSVGFLSDHQRTNVALTRARYCLWIVGNGMTLVNSGSVWKDLVIDAITRGCFHNTDKNNSFLDTSLNFDFLKLGKTRWKVLLSNDFKISVASLMTNNTRKNKVRDMLKKLADGWREPTLKKVMVDGSDLLEQYKVDKKLYLAWSIDIVMEETKYSQIIRVWDILTASELPKLGKKLSVVFGKYSGDVLNRCRQKSTDGNLVVPMSWTRVLESNSAECLTGQLASLNLRA